MTYAQKYSPIVKELLLKRADLTTQTMIEQGCGWRLAAVIHYLRKQGWPIETLLDMRRVGHYRLKSGWTPDMLAPSTCEEKGAKHHD
jgi:hypothetical protein